MASAPDGIPPESRRTIILASRSPRRLELARSAGWQVVVQPPDDGVESGQPPRAEHETLEAYVVRLARAKAGAVAATAPAREARADKARATIVACDTLSEVDGVTLGKPADASDAMRMLRTLSGRRHRVITGICVWGGCGGRLEATAESSLEMDPLSEEFLEWYIASGLWQGKAGACGFQDERLPLRLVAGSPSNVVGLPLELLDDLVAQLAAGEKTDIGKQTGPHGGEPCGPVL